MSDALFFGGMLVLILALIAVAVLTYGTLILFLTGWTLFGFNPGVWHAILALTIIVTIGAGS